MTEPNEVNIPFGFATRALIAIDFRYGAGGGGEGHGAGSGSITPPTPNPVFTCPVGARALLKGFCYGPAGALAYVSNGAANLQQPTGDQHLMFADSLVIPCGSPLEIPVNSGQTVYGLASIQPSMPWGVPDQIVYLSFAWELFWYRGAPPPVNGGYDPDAAAFEGPGPYWRKR